MSHEIDFLISKKNLVTELIQVSFISNTVNLPEREIASLVKASNRFPEAKLILITWELDQTLSIKNRTIHCVSLFNWLNY